MIDVYWWRRFRNFGDAVSPLLVSRLSGKPVRWSQSANQPVFAAVGSVVQSAKPGWHIWGSGLIAGHATVPHGLTIHALRGPRTRAVLAARGYPANVPLGDPALLLPLLFPGRSQPTFEWGIIPHYIDYPLLAAFSLPKRILSSMSGRRRVILINPFSPPQEYIRQLSSCRRVAASSLHGLIAADACGIPNVWFAPARNSLRTFCLKYTTFMHDDFKYYDYFESVGRTISSPTLVKGRIPWDEWEVQVEHWSPIRWDPVPLLEAFPYKCKEWVGLVRKCEQYFAR